MMAYCRRAKLPYINTLVDESVDREYRGCSYLAFPIEVLDRFC